MKKILTVLIAVALLAAGLRAAVTPAITATFQVLTFGGNLDGIFFQSAGSYKPLKGVANQIERNNVYTYTGVPTMGLFRRNRDPGAKDPYVQAGSVTFPA